MKRILGLIALSTVFLGLQANAETSYLSCSNGTIDQVGDGLFQINFMEDGIEFLPYEGSFTLDAAVIAYDGGTFAVLNQSTIVTSEGTETPSVIDALLTLDATATTLNVALSYDKGAYETHQLTCVKK